jgi:hypothetical protein
MAVSAALLVLTLWGLARFGRHVVPGPPSLLPGPLLRWAEARSPSFALFGLLRLVALGLGWYLLAVTVLTSVTRLFSEGRFARLVRRLTAPSLRPLVAAAVGLTLSTATITPRRAPPTDRRPGPSLSAFLAASRQPTRARRPRLRGQRVGPSDLRRAPTARAPPRLVMAPPVLQLLLLLLRRTELRGVVTERARPPRDPRPPQFTTSRKPEAPRQRTRWGARQQDRLARPRSSSRGAGPEAQPEREALDRPPPDRPRPTTRGYPRPRLPPAPAAPTRPATAPPPAMARDPRRASLIRLRQPAESRPPPPSQAGRGPRGTATASGPSPPGRSRRQASWR